MWVSKEKTVGSFLVGYLLEGGEKKSKEIGLGFVTFSVLYSNKKIFFV